MPKTHIGAPLVNSCGYYTIQHNSIQLLCECGYYLRIVTMSLCSSKLVVCI